MQSNLKNKYIRPTNLKASTYHSSDEDRSPLREVVVD
jgi:hypothetical protein